MPDLAYPGMRLLLCGINPSLWSGVAGYHFARPSNRLWPTLYEAGFTPRRLHPSETHVLREAGIGITNLVPRATARADELAADEVRSGRRRLEGLAARFEPHVVAVLGIGAYRLAWDDRRAAVGEQQTSAGGARLWALPNPSGLNAHYQQADLTRIFRALRAAL
ncbi:MAG TPA: G/U mismatch-specific DNA glycosylase [Mycobacteriales bacterium]